MSGWATFFVSIAVAIIGFMQWRTNHQKVVLDLFERRLKLYEEVNDAVILALVGEGNLTCYNAANKLRKSWNASQFLFGSDVSKAIETVRKDIAFLGSMKNRLDRDIPQAQRNEAAETVERLDNMLANWRDSFTELCLPYLKMDQKRVRTPAEWFHDKNERRLSYSDNKD